MLKKIAAMVVLVALSIAAQTPSRKPTVPAPSQKPTVPAQNRNGQDSTNELSERLGALEKRVAKLEDTVTFYKFEIDQKQDKQDMVLLDPSSRGFLRLDSDNSTFLISLEDASPYLNGYRIKLDIGNPSDATFSNAKLKVRWSHALKSIDSYDSWQKSIHEKEVTLTDDLAPGKWNSVTVDLIPCASDELGYLEVSLQTPTITLHAVPSR